MIKPNRFHKLGTQCYGFLTLFFTCFFSITTFSAPLSLNNKTPPSPIKLAQQLGKNTATYLNNPDPGISTNMEELNSINGSVSAVEVPTDTMIDHTLVEALQQDLALIQQKNHLLEKRLGQIQSNATLLQQSATLSSTMIERTKLDLMLAHANLDSANISITAVQQALITTQGKIDTLSAELQHASLTNNKNPSNQSYLNALQASLNLEQSKAELQTQTLDALDYNLNLNEKIVGLLSNLENALMSRYKTIAQQNQHQKIQNQVLALQKEQKQWLDKLSNLEQTVDALPDQGPTNLSNQELALNIFNAQENSHLIYIKLLILHLKEQVLDLGVANSSDVSVLNANIDAVNDILTNAQTLAQLIDKKKQALSFQENLNKKNQIPNKDESMVSPLNQAVLKSLILAYDEETIALKNIQTTATTYLNTNQMALKKALARRQGLPGFSWQAWQAFGQQLVLMPRLVLDALGALKDQLHLTYQKKSWGDLTFICFIEGLWFALWFVLEAGVSRYLAKITRKRDIAGNMLFIVLSLLKQNALPLLLIMGIIILQSLLALTTKLFSPFLNLILVWLIFKLVIDTAQLILLKTAHSPSDGDKLLYTELKWGLICGALITMLMVLAHQLPVNYQVADFFNRLFMLFMLIISTLILRRWRLIPATIQANLIIHRPYLMRMLTLLSFLVPLTFFSTALIGFLGYVDLAWTLARYEGIFLFVISMYMLLCGLWNDIVEWLSETCITRLQHGWVISQTLLKPLDSIIRFTLFISIFFALFESYHLTDDSVIIRYAEVALNFNLIQSKNIIITPLVILKFIAAGIIIYWASRWTRESAYRWLFAKTQDPGLRNSLAAFSQYAIVLLGILLSLQIIGIDLTGISYIFGGLAFGAAFGLRDLVKNYASGFLLLIERPVRTGDVVSIGNFEGEVTHIGMRAMTVKTWDHLEVLVPNSETFDKPFTNWTHLDSIVRTVIHLKISREDNPHQIRMLIFSVLKNNSFVVNEPPPQVYLMEMREALMEFEVRYFINLQQGKSRSEIRSEVLFGIFETFKAEGITLPYMPHDMYIHPEGKTDEGPRNQPVT